MYKIIKFLIKLLSFTILNKQKRKVFRKELEMALFPVILTRTACLGNFCFDRISWDIYSIKNHQKSRVDYLIDINEDISKKAIPESIMKYTPDEHKHLISCYEQATYDIFKYKNVKALIIDSFSELTDQLFAGIIKKDSFCTHYINVDHSKEFNSLYTCMGLINLENLKKCYLDFFIKIRKIYGNIPIILINFPTKFDERIKFKDRKKAILESFDYIANMFKKIYIINPTVERHETDDSPYHFSNETYNLLAEEIVKILNKEKIKVKLKGKNNE